MTTSHDRLSREFVEAAKEFQRRRLWREVEGDAIFLLRLPTEDLPLAANVMGQAGQEFGLGLARDEGAFRRMVGPYLDPAAMEEFTDAGDLLSLMFDPWGSLPHEYRQLYTAAGFQARRDMRVPMTLVKRPYEFGRPAGRGDLRTLLWAVRGVLLAHDVGEFLPTPLSSMDRSQDCVLELEVTGKPRNPTVTTRFVPWPKDADALDLPPLVALPEDLAKLPRVDERWILARVNMAAEIKGDPRAVFGIFVAEETSGLILSNAVAMGDELAPAAEALSQAFRGEGGLGSGDSKGLPRQIVFDSPRLHTAFAPVLAGFGIESELDQECPALLELAHALQTADFSALEEGLSGGQDGEP